MGVKLSGRIETDFFTRDIGDSPGLATSNSARLRLRHGFAQIFARQPQLTVGYKTPLARGMGDLVFEVDVEKAFTDDLGVAAVVESRGEAQTVPLFARKITWPHPRFGIEVAGVIADSEVILARGGDASETAWGIQVSGRPLSSIPWRCSRTSTCRRALAAS